jgi:hypothetical protein
MNNRPLNDIGFRTAGISFLILLTLLRDDVFGQPLTTRGLILILLNAVSIALIWQLNRAIIAYFRSAFPLLQLSPTVWRLRW